LLDAKAKKGVRKKKPVAAVGMTQKSSEKSGSLGCARDDTFLLGGRHGVMAAAKPFLQWLKPGGRGAVMSDLKVRPPKESGSLARQKCGGLGTTRFFGKG
jgi:hypothetical protein